MFTGIIEEIGTIKEIRVLQHSAVVSVSADRVLDGTDIGDSIAVNGVCLTVTAIGDRYFSADATPETISRTSLGFMERGDRVNLERALSADGRFGGHIVMGHVDGRGKVSGIRRDGNSVLLSIEACPDLMRYIMMKGSVAVDGISLTVAGTSSSGFTVAVIPHTADVTTVRYMRNGDSVNLETDIVGKYVEKLILPEASGKNSGITMEMLSMYGFTEER